ncbi:MAG: ACT domain-containing protein [Burkholderiales bacterium]|nr:ACT domain-containing protein [Burkholderiales bacterium]
MDLLVEGVDAWAATIEDKPGALANVLTTLREAGADLKFVIARRAADKPGAGVVFLTPLQGDDEIAAAAQLGFNVTHSLHTLRVLGADAPGMAALLTSKLAEAGLNLRGFSASVIGRQFVAYVAFDSAADADNAAEVLKKI